MSARQYIQQFRRNVTDKYTIYNSLFAALPFSGIARIAFICTKILRSLLDKRLIDQKFVEKIYLSIPTITKKMNKDYIFRTSKCV